MKAGHGWTLDEDDRLCVLQERRDFGGLAAIVIGVPGGKSWTVMVGDPRTRKEMYSARNLPDQAAAEAHALAKLHSLPQPRPYPCIGERCE